jgi:hypothetical protein
LAGCALTSRFQGTVESMSSTLLRTSRSGVINRAHSATLVWRGA